MRMIEKNRPMKIDALNSSRHIIAKMLLLLCPAIFFIAKNMQAQDLHYSQWFSSPLLVNPANTGFIPDADYRLGANYRSQYMNVLSSPYKTMSIWGDAQIMRDRFDNAWLGVGGAILRDQAGSGNLTSTKVYGSLAYHQMLGLSSLLTAGFNLGWAQKRVDPSKLTFPDQFNDVTGFFESGMPTSVVFNTTSINYLDIQVGVNYAYFPNENTYLNGGFSVQHVNRPKEGFFIESSVFDNRLAARYIGFVNASIKLNNLVILNPMAYYTNQAKASEFTGGLSLDYNLSGDGNTVLTGGIFYRPGDAFIPQLGFEVNNFRINFTYDATTSELKSYNGGRGAVEFSLIKKGLYPDKDARQSWCPTFKM